MFKRSDFAQPIRRDKIPQLFIPRDIDMHSFNKHMATNRSCQTGCSTDDYQHLPIDVIHGVCIRVIIRRAVLDLCAQEGMVSDAMLLEKNAAGMGNVQQIV